MALPQLYDRVQETTTTTGTGALTLAGAVAGYQAFSSVIASSAVVYYAITDTSTNWEVGQGTYTNSGATLSRTTILASSNSNSAVSFGVGTKNVWIDFPAVLADNPLLLTGVNTTEVDFGSTPVASKSFTVTDTNVVSTHMIMAVPSGQTPTGKSADELEFDTLTYQCVAGSGQFTVYAFSVTGPVIGKFKVQYVYS